MTKDLFKNINKDKLNDILNNLNDSQKQLALSIFQEYIDKGESKIFNNLLEEDWNEMPVDIETFLKDDNFLGKAWKDASGNSKLYPFWLDRVKELFPNNIDTDYDTLLESGARGIGKSEVACGVVGTYLMYRVMCLKNPLQYYHLKLTEKIVFAFMNITKDSAKKIAVDKFQKTVQMSPWFMSRGRMTSFEGNPYWIPPDPIEIVIGSQSSDVVGKPVFYAFFDEISFIKNQDIDKQKEKAMDMINTAIGGMKTRFIHKGKNPTMLVVASSKRSEQSFMEQYIRQLGQRDDGKTLVVDQPVWKVKPEGTYSNKTFWIGLGNKFLESIVIPFDAYDRLDEFKEKGYQLLEVPIDFKNNAKEDLERMLCDFAGISSTSSNKYISPTAVNNCINKAYHNPFPDILEIGTGSDDIAQYKNFFNLSYIPKEMISKPLYIHLDMSISGDMTGIAGVWINGKKPSSDPEQQANDLSFRLAFSTSVKAPKGRQISFEKNRNFIRWLKEVGFNIKEVTSDTFQSYDLQQQLSAEGFNCSILSVDRVDPQAHICKPYQYLKNAIYEKRFIMYKSDRLFDEFVDIERNINTGKVDHTPNGHKDALDAVCGATFTASKHAAEYAYQYGESLESVIDVNEDMLNYNDYDLLKQEMEQQLLSMHNIFNNKSKSDKNNDLDKGTTDYYMYDDILIM